MQQHNKKYITLIILAILAVFSIWYFIKHIDEIEQINPHNMTLIPIIFSIFLLNYWFIAISNQVLLWPFGIRIKNFESYMLAILVGFYNLITPFKGGMAVKAIYLKKKYNFQFTNFLATLTGIYVVTFLIGSSLGLLSLIIMYYQHKIFNPYVYILFLVFLIPLTIIIVFSPNISETKSQLFNKLIKIINGWYTIRKNHRVVFICTLTTFVSIFLTALMYILSFSVFGIKLSLSKALYLSCINSLAILISITPAGLGVQEIVAIFSGLAIGVTPAQSLSVAILGRAIQFISLFILGPYFSYRLIKHNTDLEEETHERSK